MIKLKTKQDCCGCEACIQICPKNALSARADCEGFLYPSLDLSNCIDCGLCERVCPVINQSAPRIPLAVYAAKNANTSIRDNSSSGGIFTLIAEQIIRENGVVFGAKFDENWNVIHAATENIEGLVAFRGSKYVQSKIGNSYKEVATYLKIKRKVLFTGTPCQISGLMHFLRKKDENLLTLEVICHGVPSPGVWASYLSELCKQHNQTSPAKLFHQINFRDKSQGWKKFSLKITNHTDSPNEVFLCERFERNIFMQGFLSDLFLRPSCHYCPAKAFSSQSDISLADFWGIENLRPDIDDDRGVSQVSINTEKGMRYYESTQLESIQVEQTTLQSAVYKSSSPHPLRKKFFRQYSSNAKTVSAIILKNLRLNFMERQLFRVKRVLVKIGFNIKF